MQELRGISVSPGIAIGPAFVYHDDRPAIPEYEVEIERLASEMDRFNTAVEKAKGEIEALKDKAEAEVSDRSTSLLDSHLLMLEDPEFIKAVKEKLRENRKNIEWVLYRAVQDIIEQLNATNQEYFQERGADVHDVAKRILNHLLHRDQVSLADLSVEVILVAHDLLPSEAIAMNKRMVRAIAMDAGGKTSHTAILARSFEIPAVLGLSNITSLVEPSSTMIVDGNAGRVILDPDDDTVSRYLEAQREWKRHEVQLMGLNELNAETNDGKLIQLMANIEVPEEVDAVPAHGADGVGLYRSEFLFLQPGRLPTEEEQYNAYSYVLNALDGKPVTIRTLDVGGDKVVPELEGLGERNPILGWRAIRFCLSRIDLFKTQLRALLRASTYGNLRIMFPMISGVEELSRVYEILDDVKEELRTEGIAFKENIPVGIMIEVPSAAMTADILARKVDFFSIGTNDLIQYTIAVDRGNEKIAYLYEPFHPGVLRLLKLIIDSGHEVGIPVGMCGEMAGDPLASLILLGLGLDEFSMSAAGIPEVKRIIRSVSMTDAEELVGSVLDMRSYEEVDAFVQDLMEKRFQIHAY
ncbi:MAG: phosphoenolpyruvate--protein phosphotransferase [Spirochaetaceae bacterium]